MKLKRRKDVRHVGNPNEFTTDQKRNLLQLADFLNTHDFSAEKVKFNMSKYAQNNGYVDFDMHIANPIGHHECQTAACAVGWGPTAGIPALKEEGWRHYCHRNFVHQETKAWYFMFGPNHVDCPRAAARRIYYALQHGIPVNEKGQAYELEISENQILPG